MYTKRSRLLSLFTMHILFNIIYIMRSNERESGGTISTPISYDLSAAEGLDDHHFIIWR